MQGLVASTMPISGVGFAGLALIRSMKIRSEEHTSELQSRPHLVCRLLLEKKKNTRHSPVVRVESNVSITSRTCTFDRWTTSRWRYERSSCPVRLLGYIRLPKCVTNNSEQY